MFQFHDRENEEKPKKKGIIGENSVIKRSDLMLGLGNSEKNWQSRTKLRMVARHKRFVEDPSFTFIMSSAPLWVISTYFFTLSGAESPEEYLKSLEEVYGKPVDKDTLMFMHFYGEKK